ALLSEADAAYSSSSWDAALEAYKKALETDPTSAVACRRMADVLAIRGRFADVLDAYFRLIDILEAQGDLDGALEVAHWVMNLKPDSDQARMKMIFAYHKKGDLKEVVRQSRELARLYIDLGQGDQSIQLLQQAQKADPENLDIGLELAEMYVSHGHIQDGANQYRKVANAFLDQRNLEKAAEAFRRMKVIVPDDPGVLLTLGNLYVDLKRYNEAEQEYRSILRHNLNHEEALLALGRVCQLKKQFRDAILAFNRILSINPDEVTAKEKLGELYQAQGLSSESIKNYLSAAQSYLEFEERDKAIRLFQIVLGLDPANPTACRELTNLGAPLVGIRNEELEPPPEPAAPEKPEAD
ncbi:unnamed protein product, partial [Phaeothamnion confervicola]